MTYDPNLPADRQGQFDPGNDEPEVLFDEDGEPVTESDEDETDYQEGRSSDGLDLTAPHFEDI